MTSGCRLTQAPRKAGGEYSTANERSCNQHSQSSAAALDWNGTETEVRLTECEEFVREPALGPVKHSVHDESNDVDADERPDERPDGSDQGDDIRLPVRPRGPVDDQ